MSDDQSISEAETREWHDSDFRLTPQKEGALFAPMPTPKELGDMYGDSDVVVRIVSDGHPGNARTIDAKTGRTIGFIRDVRVDIPLCGAPTAYIEAIIVPLDLTAKAMVRVRCSCCGHEGKIDECLAPGSPPA